MPVSHPLARTATVPFDVSVLSGPRVGHAPAVYAEERVRHACAHAPDPVRYARVALAHDGNPSLERPCVAKASIEIDGRFVRAHVAAATIVEAIDLIEERLRRQFEQLGEREETRRSRTGVPEPGNWRHGDLPTSRPAFFPRPLEERRLIRRKSYALGVSTPEEAAWEMDLLDHDFHLFTDAASGEEAVVFRRHDGVLGIQVLEPSLGGGAYVAPFVLEPAPAPELTLEEAVQELDVTDAPFVLFRDRSSGRGDVVYRRYDGHHGVIVPAA